MVAAKFQSLQVNADDDAKEDDNNELHKHILNRMFCNKHLQYAESKKPTKQHNKSQVIIIIIIVSFREHYVSVVINVRVTA